MKSYMSKVETYIPKKYRMAIQDFYRDADGVWLELKSEYISTSTGTSTIHEFNINDVRKQLKTIVKNET